MKPFLPLKAVVAGFLLISAAGISCKKTDVADMQPKEALVAQKWIVNRMQLKIYSGGTFVKDTIIKQNPQPVNFIQFGTDGSFQYCFNSKTIDVGTYQFVGADSIVATAGSKVFRWKMLTLTSQLLTTSSTSNNDPYYPGAIIIYPGAVIENYLTLAPPK